MENGPEAADAAPIERKTVMLDIFQRLAGSGRMGSAAMRWWAGLTGWDKSEDKWEAEWQSLCADLKVSPTDGLDAVAFMKFLSDKTEAGCFMKDNELREMQVTLHGIRESSVSSVCALHTKGAPDSAEHTGMSEPQSKTRQKKRNKGKYPTSKDNPDLDDLGWSKTKPCEASCGRPAAGGYKSCCRWCLITGTLRHGPKCDYMWSERQEAEASATIRSHSDRRDWGSHRAQETSCEGTDASAVSWVTSIHRYQWSWDQHWWRSSYSSDSW